MIPHCQIQKSARWRETNTTNDDHVLSSNEHQCGAPVVAGLEVQKSVNQAQKKAREEDNSISKIYSD